MNKKKIAAVAGIAAAVCLLAGGGIYAFTRQSGSSENAQVYVTTVSSLTEVSSGVENRYAGVVEPQKTVNVRLDGNSTVKDVKVQEGQSVKAGDVLFEYDLSSNQDKLAEAQLELERLQNEALSLQEQMETYQKELDNAQEEQSQLSYNIQIQTAKMNLKKNEYSQKSKQAEIERLQKASTNTQVTSEIDGIISNIDTSQIDNSSGESAAAESGSDGSSDSKAFITILSTGSYRVKGTVNEQNVQSIVEGSPVIIRSRVNEEQTWKGTMGSVDTKNPVQSTSSVMADSTGSSASQTTSSSYPFYVDMESSEGLMLGQHVYIEMDYGQDDMKDGLWLDEYYIVDPKGSPYVWAADKNDRLEKRSVKLGEYQEETGKYQILEGLTENDCIAFPTDELKEGMRTAINEDAQIPTGENGSTSGTGESEDPVILEENVNPSNQESDSSEEPAEDVISEDMGTEVIDDSTGTSSQMTDDSAGSTDVSGGDVITEDGSAAGDGYSDSDYGEELQEGQILEEVEGPPTEGE